MADLVITAANVVQGTDATTITGRAGATITAGQQVYKDPTTGLYLLSDSNSATAAARSVDGIALNSASNGQPLTVLTAGPITIGATVSPGVGYYLSATPGGICPVADLTTGCYPVFLGFATSASVINVKIQAAGVALP
jgi:hypothetical protein